MGSWRARVVDEGTRTHVMGITGGDEALRWSEVIELLTRNAEFRAFLRDVWAGSPFSAFFWETPPITLEVLERPFQRALVEAPSLARTAPDASAFADRFARSDADVAVFPNLGGDAILVVPCPRGPHDAYAHLASFVRRAPTAQVDALLCELGRAVAGRVSDEPLWVSTAGLGVSWLHVRLDDRPKYYRHSPYVTFTV